MAKLPGARLGGEGMEEMPKIEPQKAETGAKAGPEKPKKPSWFKKAMGIFSERQAAEYVEQMTKYLESQENVGRTQAEARALETVQGEIQAAIDAGVQDLDTELAAEKKTAAAIGPEVAQAVEQPLAELSEEERTAATMALKEISAQPAATAEADEEAYAEISMEPDQELPSDRDALQTMMENLTERYNQLFEKSLQEAQNLSDDEKKVFRRALKTGSDKEINALPESPTMQELKIVKGRMEQVRQKLEKIEAEEKAKAGAATIELEAEVPTGVDKEAMAAIEAAAQPEQIELSAEKELQLKRIAEAYNEAEDVDNFMQFMLKDSDLKLTKQMVEGNNDIYYFLKKEFVTDKEERQKTLGEGETMLRFEDLLDALPIAEEYAAAAQGKEISEAEYNEEGVKMEEEGEEEEEEETQLPKAA